MSYVAGVYLGFFVGGCIWGLIPLIIGICKKRTLVGFGLMALCGITAFIGNIIPFWTAVISGSILLAVEKEEKMEEEESASMKLRTDTESLPINKLAGVLDGIASAEILEHCDSVMHNKVLLETYLMQCVNNKKISKTTAEFLQEQYTRAREQAVCTPVAKVPAKNTFTISASRNINEINSGVEDNDGQEAEIFMTRRGESPDKYGSWVCPECETVNTKCTCFLCGYRRQQLL